MYPNKMGKYKLRVKRQKEYKEQRREGTCGRLTFVFQPRSNHMLVLKPG